MYRPRAYLDTSVPSAYFDERAPDRQELTREFWHGRLPQLDAGISTFVLQEIYQAPSVNRREEMLKIVQGLDILPYDQEARELALEYVKRGVFSEKTAGDAVHVGIAVANGVGYLISWNFKHLVKVSIRRQINLINALMGFGSIEIVAPPEL